MRKINKLDGWNLKRNSVYFLSYERHETETC